MESPREVIRDALRRSDGMGLTVMAEAALLALDDAGYKIAPPGYLIVSRDAYVDFPSRLAPEPEGKS